MTTNAPTPPAAPPAPTPAQTPAAPTQNAAADAAPPAAPAPAPAVEKDTRNGITRPKAGTATGRVWEIADELSKAAGQAAARKDVLKKTRAEGINDATCATQLGRWRKYYGIKAEPRAPKEPKSEGTTTQAAGTGTPPPPPASVE